MMRFVPQRILPDYTTPILRVLTPIISLPVDVYGGINRLKKNQGINYEQENDYVRFFVRSIFKMGED